jgi:peptidoglycan/LPS O-acetylase OafA/YrhL
MIGRYNRTSLLFGVPGLLLQFGGPVAAFAVFPEVPRLQELTVLAGTLLLLIGLAYYAMAKGRSPWWCLLAFFSCIGFLGLAVLADKSSGLAEDTA